MSTRPTDPHLQFGRAWREHHRYVLDVAFRMLGNLAEAEDAVQEAYARLLRVDIDDLADVRGWLVVAVSRVCLDRLRAQRRRPATPTETFDEDRAPTPDPADRVTLDDSVRLALHLVLERLSPAERTAFVLHDVFQYSFDEVGEIVGRSPAACRQLASRARHRIHSEAAPARFSVEPAAQHLVTERFIAACEAGNVDALLTVLDPDVDGDVDLGFGPFSRPNANPQVVAETLIHYFGADTGNMLVSVPVPDGAAVAAFHENHLNALISFDLQDGLITEVHVLLDPVKLAPLEAVLAGG